MKLPINVCRVAWLCLVAAVFAHAPLRGAEQSGESAYESQLAGARRLAGEKSWALARDAYAEAARVAPDAETRRQCELSSVDAAWRAIPPDARNSFAGSQQREEITAMFDALLSDYKKGNREKDSFWVAVMKNRVEYYGVDSWHRDAHAQLNDLETLADFFAGLPATGANTAAHIESLRAIAAEVSRLNYVDDGRRENLLRRFEQAGGHAGFSTEDRAWCVLQRAVMSTDFRKVSVAEQRARLAAAVGAAQGTRWLPVARARLFVFETLKARAGGDVANDTPADIPALMEKIAGLRRELAPAPEQPETRAADALLEGFLKWWRHPMLEVEAPDFVAPGAPLRFNYATANCGDVTAELYQLPDNSKTRPDDAYEFRRAGIIPTAEHYKDWNAEGALLKKITLAGSPAESGAWVSESVEITNGLKPGFYALGLTGAGEKPKMCVSSVIVSDYRAFAVFERGGARRLLVYRQDSGAPAAGMEISGVQSGKTWSAKTDDDGFATLPPEFVWNTGKDARTGDFLAFADGQPLWIGAHMFFPSSNYYDMYPARSDVWGDVFFDRPLYCPGETVHWKIIARERRDGRFVACEKKLALTFELENSEDALVDKLPLALNKNGTAHGSFVLPGDLRPGRANAELTVERSDAKSENERRESGDVHMPHAFFVDNYATSSIRATAEQLDLRAGARPGSDLVFVVRAEYFSGSPVTGAPVRAAFSIVWNNEENIPAELADKINGWIESRKKELLEFVTDAKGEAFVRLPLPSFLREATHIEMNANVLLDGAPPAKARARAVTTVKDLLFVNRLRAGKGFARTGEDVVFTARIEGVSGDARAFSGEARVMEMQWEPHWCLPDGTRVSTQEREALLRQSGPDAVEQLIPARVMREPEWNYSEVARFSVSCGDDGQLKIPFTPGRAGLYTVQLFSDGASQPVPDYRGKLADDTPTLIVADELTTDLALPPKTGRVLGLEDWKAGESLRALVIMPEGVHRTVLTVYAENDVVTRIVQSSGRVAWVSIERAPRALGGVQYVLWNERRGGLMEMIATHGVVSVDSGKSSRLAVKVVPEAAASRPGELASVKIVTQDSEGRAVPAEIAVTVSDQAVEELAGDDARSRIMNLGSFPWYMFFNAQVGATYSWSKYDGAKRLQDFRPGTLLNPTDGLMSHDALRISDIEEWLFDQQRSGAARSIVSHRAAINVANIRRHFSSTAFWAPEIMTDANGQAVVSFKYPDNLTQWNIRAIAVGEDGNSFGDGAAFTRTTLPFQARLQAPRYLIEGDRAVLSALLVNTTDKNLTATTSMVVRDENPSDVLILDTPADAARAIAIAPQSDTRVTAWPVRSPNKGGATIRFSAQTEEESDGMETKIPVLEDGLRQDIAASARLAPDARECSLALDMPEKLDRSRMRVTLHLSPSQAAAMLDALPYLIDYPHGCVEQTMSRFMPAVLVKKTLADFGLDAAALEKRIMQNTQAGPQKPNAATNATALDDVISQSLARLAGAEIEDGTFGWWPGARRADPWMTAYVGWGLQLAKNAGVKVSESMLERVTTAVFGQVTATGADKCADDIAAWMLSIIAQAGWRTGGEFEKDEKKLCDVFARVYAARDGLTSSGRACLLIAAGRFGAPDEKAVLLRNLENGAWRARAAGMGGAHWSTTGTSPVPRPASPLPGMGDTVHWGADSGYFRASEGAVESTALSLLALLQADTAHPLVEPAANWLMLNRRGTAWQNTRATALAILALNQYLVTRMTEFPEAKIEVLLNGKLLRALTLNRDTLTAGGLPENMLEVDARLLREGKNTITLRRISGTSPVYATALASAWAGGDAVKPAGHLVAVSRDFIRQKIERGPGGSMRIAPSPMDAAAGEAASPGEMVTARVALSVPNALDYVMLTVPKPAGCEPVNALSGWDARLVRTGGKSGNDNDDDDNDDDDDFDNDILSSAVVKGRRIYREEHDDHSAFFLDHVGAGEWEIRFTMRAVTPGDFRALPVKVEAMYAPEIRANSDARRVGVRTAHDGADGK